jgi:AmmeMemoRadiSam system protein B
VTAHLLEAGQKRSPSLEPARVVGLVVRHFSLAIAQACHFALPAASPSIGHRVSFGKGASSSSSSARGRLCVCPAVPRRDGISISRSARRHEDPDERRRAASACEFPNVSSTTTASPGSSPGPFDRRPFANRSALAVVLGPDECYGSRMRDESIPPPVRRHVYGAMETDDQDRQMFVLRDTLGIADEVRLPPVARLIVPRLNGRDSYRAIASAVARELGTSADVNVVFGVVQELGKALILQDAIFDAAHRSATAAFATLTTRAAIGPGGDYPASPEHLRTYLSTCLAIGDRRLPASSAGIVALIAPHLDLPRGLATYGHAYGSLARRLAPEVDTVVLFGTAHAPMTEPFAMCRKAFDTPLGPLECDRDVIEQVARRCAFDVYADEFHFMREHSIEYHVLFLKYILGDRLARIVPVLSGLGKHRKSKTDPAGDASAMSFLDAMRELVARRGRRVVVVASADLSHVGPSYGDSVALDAAARARLADADRFSLAKAEDADASGFWADVVSDLGVRRICGLAPVYSLLKTVSPGVRGQLLHYEQALDPGDGSVVTHAAMTFSVT